jgi:hypothetical protein
MGKEQTEVPDNPETTREGFAFGCTRVSVLCLLLQRDKFGESGWHTSEFDECSSLRP